MKIYSKIKGNNQCIIRLLGIKLFHKKQEGRWSKIKYLYGLLKIKKCPNVKKVYFCGLQIFSRKILDITEVADNIKNTVINELKSTIINETRMANAVSNLHSRVFPQFKNINTGKDVVIVGTGPSLNFYENMKNTVNIGMNRAFEFNGITFDYYFLAHYSDITAEYIEKISDKNFVKFYGRYLSTKFKTWNTPNCITDKHNSYKYYIDSYMPDFVENLDVLPFKNGGSIAISAIQFALWTHPKRIFLVGCDCSMNGYYNSSIHQPMWAGLNETLRSYPLLKHFAEIYYPDVEIISVNPVGLRGLFRDVYTESYVKAEAALFKDVSDIEYLQDIINEVNV